MADENEISKKVPLAKEVYLLMQNDYRISRNIRAQWFLNHLNKDLHITPKFSKSDCTKEIEVISAVPKNSSTNLGENGESYTVHIVPDTKIIFLASCYRLVFCLDISSSVATVEVQHGTLFFEEIIPSLKQSLEKVCQPFYVPGSKFHYVPKIYVTIVAHIPNCPSGVPQVIIQGWILTSSNVSSLLCHIEKTLCKVSERVSKGVSKVNSDSNKPRVSPIENASSVSSLSSYIDSSKLVKVPQPNLSADISTLNLLRYGILALQLLPENSSAGIVVITDGILIFPSTQMQDSLLAQLRNSTISCSFLQIGSPYHPFACLGRIPYRELLQFISAATCGAYFPSPHDLNLPLEMGVPNAYHEAFLFWSFHTTRIPDFFKQYQPSLLEQSFSTVENPHFHCVANQSRVRKKHAENSLKVSFENVLSCRLREGYTVKNVTVDEGKNTIEVKLLLPWNLSSNFEYIIRSTLHSPTPSQQSNLEVEVPNTFYELIVDGCYEFLHDVTCSIKKPIKSCYRNTVISQFWNYVKNLSYTDQILIQLHSFSQNPAYYTLPENIKNGIPLFYLPTNSTTPHLLSESMAHSQFTTFWKPLCMLDINVWQKWMHTHRIGVLLQHDIPLPKNLHLPNASGRYLHIQCRQASTTLSTLLNDYCTFVLVENQFYIKFLYKDSDEPPVSFYVIRVTSKGPCVVIRLAFLGGLPGYERNEIVKELQGRICNLKFPKRAPSNHHTVTMLDEPHQSSTSDMSCCNLLKKPVEKILIRYDRLPRNFMASILESQLNPQKSPYSITDHVVMNMIITLSKYLHHKRWVWSMQCAPNTSLALPVVSRMLSILTKIRLKQSFHFSHSSLGIIYLLLEIPMKISLNETDDVDNGKEFPPCAVQYLLFPPHTNTTLKDSVSEDEDSELPEADGELQLITECWVEPQYGLVASEAELSHFNGITYQEIANAFFAEDLEVVSVLTTFEHLSMCCQKNETTFVEGSPSNVHSSISNVGNISFQHHRLQSEPIVLPVPTTNVQLTGSLDGGISLVPYCFNIVKLLSKCHQSEFLFPTLNHSTRCDPEHPNLDPPGEQITETNELLIEFLSNNVKLVHDQELLLTDEDFMGFLLQVHHRDRSSNAPSAPFGHPIDIPKFSYLFKQFHSPHCDHCCSFKNQSHESAKSDLADFSSWNVPKWRCFMKSFSSNHFIVTLIPATYSGLKQLIDLKFHSTCAEEDIGVEADSKIHVSNEEQPCDAHAIDKTVMESVESSHEANILEKQPTVLPVYVFDCVLSSINNLLVKSDATNNLADEYDTFKFKYEEDEDVTDITTERKVDVLKYSESDNFNSNQSGTSILANYHSLVDKLFCKSFVYSVYRSLVLDLGVDKCDVMAAIDEVCEESFLEVDITDFVYSICGHIKDFTTKHSLRQRHLTSETSKSGDTTSECNQTPTSGLTPERATMKCFPLSLLQRHQPCEHLKQKHLDIKNKFSEILGGYLKKIPSRPDYYIFYPVEENEEPSIHDDAFDDTEEMNPTIINNVPFDKAPLNVQEDIVSLDSRRNTQSSLSSLDADPESSSSQDKLYWPPLFVHLLCSLKSKHDIKSCSMSSLPTCFGDLQKCINPQTTEVDLNEFHITLDVTCLTLFSEIECSTNPKERQCSMSFSSSSPVPEPEHFKDVPVNEDDASSENLSEGLQLTALRNVPAFQRESIYRCIDKIKWLLLDEKASAALNSYPITSETLNLVSEHVMSSKNKPCCITQEVPLKFVFGPESSVEKFIQVFQRMRLPGYRLNEQDNFYYLVLDDESAGKQEHAFGSLNPPLGFASKLLMTQKNTHCDDITTLNAIGRQISNPLPHSSNDPNDSTTIVDQSVGESDSKSAELGSNHALLNQKVYLNKPVPRKKFRKLFTSDKTDIEDCPKRPVLIVPGKLAQLPRANSLPSPMTTKATLTRNAYSLPSNLHLVGRKYDDFDDRHLSLPHSTVFKPISKSSASEGGLLSPNKWMDFGPDMPAVSPGWELPLKSPAKLSASSGPSGSKFKIIGSSDSPQIFSDEYASVFGSCQLSNTEDGYDGDSSDCGSELDWLCAIDTKRPILPNFWLIMTVASSKVTIYFHLRNCDNDDEELKRHKDVLKQITDVIANICKEVNQTLLLQSLHETRKCNQLLVAEDCDDIWKKNDFSTSDPHGMFSEDDNLYDDVPEKYLEANLRFMPGIFNCDIVWVTHFRLHHRLYYGSTSNLVPKGIQALRTVLNTFSVNNRENMFVYQERSGSVFYIRLYEEICDTDHCLNSFKTEGYMSPSGSCCSSLQTTPQPKAYHESENDGDFRPRVDSGHSDVDRQDSLSNISTSKNPQKCVALYVHGIGEVGTEIKEDLVHVLQNRLNEAVLDMIIMMLSRNPLCKLTVEDVQFIQNPSQPPCSEINFIIPMKLLCSAHSIHIYLRQNLLNFVYNPKYTDSRRETHFKAYSKQQLEWTHVDDSDIFLYPIFQASGYTANRGIACIVLSLVSGQGNGLQYFNNSAPSPTAYQEGVSENDFEDLTSIICATSKKNRTPGPVALVRFQVWTVGKISLEHMESQLHTAVRHALWDLLMEYRILTAPILESVTYDDFVCVSEPTTPVRARRSGRTAVTQNLKELPTSLAAQTSKETSSSFPDLAATSEIAQTSTHEFASFRHNVRPQSARFYTTLNDEEKVSPSATQVHQGRNDKCSLNHIFHVTMKLFLQFGNNLACPALSKHVFQLTTRHCVPIIITEMQTIIEKNMRDLNPHVFLRFTNILNADSEFVPYKATSDESETPIEESRPGTEKSFIIIGRNENQWRSYMGISDFSKFHDSHSNVNKNYQHFKTHICKPISTDVHPESMPTSPTSMNQFSSGGGALMSPNVKIGGFSNLDGHDGQSQPAFVPRQCLLLVYIEDKEITIYLYNWSSDVTSNFLKQLTKLLQWHECRDSLMNNVVLQKLGLFRSQPVLHKPEKTQKPEPPIPGKKISDSVPVVTWNVAEQLFQLHSPPRDAQSALPSVTTPNVLHMLKNTRPPVPMHLSRYCTLQDRVKKHGHQLQDIRKAQKRDMQELYTMWQARGTTIHTSSVNRMLFVFKSVARFSHYCLTPILFSPSWRWKVAPIRDHTIEPPDYIAAFEKSPSDSSSLNRSRHGSGNSVKNADGTSGASSLSSRSRRTSGAQSLSHGSPKLRVKYPSEEAWHHSACNQYLLEYIQYLHTLGFVSLQTKESPLPHGVKKSMTTEDIKHSKVSSSSLPRTSMASPPVFYLMKYHLGGLLLFEVGLCDPYAYAYLYTIDYSRLHSHNPRNSQFTSAFLDEVDKIKALMHLHSFTYDYHLRTIHSYISGRQLIFRHGYHLTSFLDDFIKYYQKAPNCARNLLYAGSVLVSDINMPDHQLYNYIISHNQLYGMTVLRMVPIIHDSSLMMDTEFVLVELSVHKASYKDTNDVCQIGSFDIGLLINHNTTELNTDKNSIFLNYYIILTSQRELFPKLANFGATFGSFQTVRFPASQTPSAYSSRKTSTVSMIDKDKLEASGEDTSSGSNDSRSRKITSVMGITDEEVTYLGYFSSQETMMQEVLLSEAKNAQTHLSGVFIRASIHCRRDFLWSSLLPRSFKEEEGASGKDFHTSITSVEFSELLDLVSSIPLDDIDENLRPFMTMHISWYKSLSSVLKAKYGDSCREFRDPDHSTVYVAVTHAKCPDVFVLLSINAHEKRGELSLVFRDVDRSVKPSADKHTERPPAHHAMVEEFVNACCFQMWSSLVN